MHISDAEVHNYKSYNHSGRLELTPGFNIITGQNNAGKTALLEALSLRFINKPHLSTRTLPKPTSRVDGISYVEFTVTATRDELLNILAEQPEGFRIASLPLANGAADSATHDFLLSQTLRVTNEKERQTFAEWVLSYNEYRFSFRVDGDAKLEGNTYPPSGTYQGFVSGTSHAYIHCVINPDGTITAKAYGAEDTSKNEFGYLIGNLLRRRVYTFRAERMNVAVCPFGKNSILEPNARNLPEVLNIFQSNVGRYRRYMQHVQQVLPQVKWVSVRPYDDDPKQLEIVVWNEDPELEREDLTVPLSESGTGISQVLAILYVILTADHSRSIIIDEPQSFLHPGAVRKLIDLLRDYTQHQFIISTHSPTVITASNPQTITMVRQDGAESVLKRLNVAETNQLRMYLADIGARLSDVFGADDVLWVEGKTEEICFPMILEKLAGRSLMGTTILGVQHTGDLEGKFAERVFDIYERLTRGQGLLPPAIGFIFDKEGRTEREQEDLKRKSGGRVEFIGRRLYENYLLNPEAIAAVLNKHDSERESLLTTEEVQSWLDEKGHEAKYERGIAISKGAEAAPWIEFVHGAHVLTDLFANLSEGRVSYDKVVHSVQITEWLIANSPDDLQELSTLIETVLDKKHTGRRERLVR